MGFLEGIKKQQALITQLKSKIVPLDYKTLKHRLQVREIVLILLILLADYILVQSFPKTTLVPEKYLHKLSKPLFGNQKVTNLLTIDDFVHHRWHGI
jgi:hypothetical protein